MGEKRTKDGRQRRRRRRRKTTVLLLLLFEEYEDSTNVAYDTITDDDDRALKIIHSAHALKSDDRARGDEIGADAV